MEDLAKRFVEKLRSVAGFAIRRSFSNWRWGMRGSPGHRVTHSGGSLTGWA